MNNNVLTIEQASKTSRKLKEKGKKIVLVGGCFDILHVGHLEFLKLSKKNGDILIIALESDKRVTYLKGTQRPINSQSIRADNLANLSVVDYVITLPYFEKDYDYEALVKGLEPDIIAVTKPDRIFDIKKKYADMVGGKVVEVMNRNINYSTTNIAQGLKL